MASLLMGVGGLLLAADGVLDLWRREDGSAAAPTAGDRAAARRQLLETSELVQLWYDDRRSLGRRAQTAKGDRRTGAGRELMTGAKPRARQRARGRPRRPTRRPSAADRPPPAAPRPSPASHPSDRRTLRTSSRVPPGRRPSPRRPGRSLRTASFPSPPPPPACESRCPRPTWNSTWCPGGRASEPTTARLLLMSLFLSRRLDQAAVDHVVDAGHVRGALRGQERDQRRNLLRSREAARGDARSRLLADRVRVHAGGLCDGLRDAVGAEPQIGADLPGRDAVHTNALRPELLRER